MISREAAGPVSAATDNEAQNSDQLGGPVGFLATPPGRALQGVSASGQDDIAVRPDRMRRLRTEARPIELLRDERGVYGIGVSDLFDFEAVALSCGIEPEGGWYHAPRAFILRPDRFAGTEPRRAVLQKIFGGYRRSIFSRSNEEHFRRFIHHRALWRAGLPWPPDNKERWWSADPKQQARNRGVYHGLRRLSLHVINELIGKALAEAADPDALKAARHFAFAYREKIYRAAAQSRRALQLTSTFPLLAVIVYGDRHLVRSNTDFNSSWQQTEEFDALRQSAAELVEKGAPLRDIAAALGVPFVLRRIKPGAAHHGRDIFFEHPEWLAFMPDTLPRARIWMAAVQWAHKNGSEDFAEWTARRVSEIPGGLEQVGSLLPDLSDWVCAPEGAGSQYVTRRFVPTMSLRTVMRLSAEWHEAVASHMSGPDIVFPSPWYPAAKIGDYGIIPIDNSADLYREGAAMHHCVGTYSESVRHGTLYVYSVRKAGECVAIFSLVRGGYSASLSEIRGPCNAKPPDKIVAAVKQWLRAQPRLPRSN